MDFGLLLLLLLLLIIIIVAEASVVQEHACAVSTHAVFVFVCFVS